MNKSIVLVSIVYCVAAVSIIFTIGHMIYTLPDDATPFESVGVLLIYGVISGLFLIGLEIAIIILCGELFNYDKP